MVVIPVQELYGKQDSACPKKVILCEKKEINRWRSTIISDCKKFHENRKTGKWRKKKKQGAILAAVVRNDFLRWSISSHMQWQNQFYGFYFVSNKTTK